MWSAAYLVKEALNVPKTVAALRALPAGAENYDRANRLKNLLLRQEMRGAGFKAEAPPSGSRRYQRSHVSFNSPAAKPVDVNTVMYSPKADPFIPSETVPQPETNWAVRGGNVFTTNPKVRSALDRVRGFLAAGKTPVDPRVPESMRAFSDPNQLSIL